MTFLNPWAFLALLVLAALIAGLIAWRRRRPAAGVPHPDLDLILAAAPAPRLRRFLPAALATLAAVALVVALARPETWRDEPREQATIVLAIDVSGSMAAADVEPNRLAAAQEAAHRFAETVPRQYQVGLVRFSGDASVVLPPTTDRLALDRAIDSLVANGATAIGDAVTASIEAIRRTQGDRPVLSAARILLLSDGTSTTGVSVDSAARLSRDAGAPVFTVALGTPDGVLIDGRRVPPNPEALAHLAEATGGDSFEARDADSVSSVYERLGSFIGTERVRAEVTAWPAGAAVALIILAGVAAWRLGPRLT